MSKFIDDAPFSLPRIICNNCMNYIEDGKCSAFPEGIPFVIYETNDHSKPLPEQENNIVYVPIKT